MTGLGADGADHGSDQHDNSEEVGTIAEEAFRLFRAVTSGGDSGEHASEHVCPTSWCPVCQVVGFVQHNPEALAAVTQSAVAFAKSVRDLVDVALAPQEEQ
ncbi:hypothetical protein [Aeromicrobium sp. P5_D10]